MPDLKDKVATRVGEMSTYLARSGAAIELVDIQDGIARIRLSLTRPRPNRLVASLQLKSGIERALLDDIPELRGVEAINLPPYSELGWDQPGFVCSTGTKYEWAPSERSDDNRSIRGPSAARTRGASTFGPT